MGLRLRVTAEVRLRIGIPLRQGIGLGRGLMAQRFGGILRTRGSRRCACVIRDDRSVLLVGLPLFGPIRRVKHHTKGQRGFGLSVFEAQGRLPKRWRLLKTGLGLAGGRGGRGRRKSVCRWNVRGSGIRLGRRQLCENCRARCLKWNRKRGANRRRWWWNRRDLGNAVFGFFAGVLGHWRQMVKLVVSGCLDPGIFRLGEFEVGFRLREENTEAIGVRKRKVFRQGLRCLRNWLGIL